MQDRITLFLLFSKVDAKNLTLMAPLVTLMLDRRHKHLRFLLPAESDSKNKAAQVGGLGIL